MTLSYRRMEKKDIAELTKIMKDAFDEDTRMHTDLKEDGPNGYDDGRLLEKLLDLKNARSCVINDDGQMIGGYTVRINQDVSILEMLFIDPIYSSKGLGQQIWHDIEQCYPEVITWMLETPAYSKRNHHFYEKCGFKQMGERRYTHDSVSFVYIKHLQKSEIQVKTYLEDRDYDHILLSCQKEQWARFYTSQKEAYKKALRHSITYVAYDKDVYSGYIRCITDGFFTIYCCEIIVDEKYRRQGVGQQLIETVRQAYPTSSMDVLSDNDSFYLANDFKLLCHGLRKQPG